MQYYYYFTNFSDIPPWKNIILLGFKYTITTPISSTDRTDNHQQIYKGHDHNVYIFEPLKWITTQNEIPCLTSQPLLVHLVLVSTFSAGITDLILFLWNVCSERDVGCSDIIQAIFSRIWAVSFDYTSIPHRIFTMQYNWPFP